MKTRFGFSSFVAMLAVLAVVASLFAFVSPSNAGSWTSDGKSDDGSVGLYTNTNGTTYVQCSESGGYCNYSTTSGGISGSNLTYSTVQSTVALGQSLGLTTTKTDKNGYAYNILDLSTLFSTLGF